MNGVKYTPVQIIGTQRSGSNLLRLLLNELDDVIAPHPPHILKTFMPLIPYYPDLSVKNNFLQLIEDVCQIIETNPVVWENVTLDRDRIYRECREQTLVEIFNIAYGLMAEANKATYWVCKSMANVKYGEQIEADNIRPFYIHLVRDGRDVATSFKNVAVGEKHIYHLAKNWHSLQELSSAWTDKIGASRAMTIRYEDLIHQPEHTMKQTCDFLDLPFSPKIFKFFNSDESRHTAESGFMWENLNKPIIKNNSQKYKKTLSKNEIEIFEGIAGETLNKFGYDVSKNSNSVVFDKKTLKEFELENERLKNEIKLKDHLRIDLSKRENQEKCIDNVKRRLLGDKAEYV